MLHYYNLSQVLLVNEPQAGGGVALQRDCVIVSTECVLFCGLTVVMGSK